MKVTPETVAVVVGLVLTFSLGSFISWFVGKFLRRQDEARLALREREILQLISESTLSKTVAALKTDVESLGALVREIHGDLKLLAKNVKGES